LSTAANDYTKQYTYTDTDPLHGISYYRVKQTDMDGRFTYSKIVSVHENNQPSILVGPNPISNIVQVLIPSVMTGIYECRISNEAGVVLLKKQLTSGTSTLNTQSIKKGIYIITLRRNKTVVYVGKLVK
jgi:Secretion system C-terminal sorting domain